MIGYSGTGYHGMQLNHNAKTIEGDLFQAFVKAGAVSKANADDPKKIGFVRCARTDKGVHAAGNVISLKLIIEDENIIQKINSHLSPQIRVWGIERTINSFSAYNLVDSRIYEYLIPTHCLLPPHPRSYLGRRIQALAKEMNDAEGLQERQAEVADFWARAEDDFVKPVLDSLGPRVAQAAYDSLFEGHGALWHDSSKADQPISSDVQERITGEQATSHGETSKSKPGVGQLNELDGPTVEADDSPISPGSVEQAARRIKAAILAAKTSWRISENRSSRIRDALSRYGGVHNYHNYTVQKSFKDPSAKRVIKSFVIGDSPILIEGSEWLSLKVHGQSFMMHQIRKMVGLATLAVRCGADLDLIPESMGPERMSIPRAPGLGLLLERPVFDSYNEKLTAQQGGPARGDVGFVKYKEEVEEFKQREIYERIYREEKAGNVFHQLFWAIDNLQSTQYLYLSSKRFAAVERGRSGNAAQGDPVDDVDGGLEESDEEAAES